MSNPWITHLKKVRQDNPSLSYKQCMIKGKQSYQKKQKGGSISESLWNAIKKVGKVAAIATLAIPATALASQVALAAYLSAQPDGGAAKVNKGITAIINRKA